MRTNPRRRSMRFTGAVAILALGLLAASCGTGAEAESTTGGSVPTATTGSEQTFVGKIEGTDSFVAVVTDGAQVLAYLCDGAKVWHYLEAAEAAESITAGDASSPTILDATRSVDSLTGRVVLPGDGVEHTFTATLATGDAGFFTLEQRSGDVVTQGGWIRLEDGSIRGKQVAVNVAGDNVGTVEPDGAGGGGSATTTVPPGAEPASLLGLAACGIAGARLAIAVNRYNRDKSATNQQAVKDAVETANARCSTGAAT